MAEIESQIDELNDQPRKYREDEMPLAGAIVALENHGQAVVYRGLVRPSDKKKVKAAKAASIGQNGEEISKTQREHADIRRSPQR